MKKKSIVTKNAIEQIVRRIARNFSPEKIILFGSFARGDARYDSDVDLLVVFPNIKSKRKKQIEIRLALHHIQVPKDVVVATSQEFLTQSSIPGSIPRAAYQEGKVLYEKAA